MSKAAIRKTIFLNASRERVWDYLTDKDRLGEWFYKGQASLSEGNDYTLVGEDSDGETVRKCWGSVKTSNRPEELVYTFTFAPLSGAMTTVTWRLQEAFGGTMLTLKHEGIGEAAGDAALPMLMDLDAGWDRHLGLLRQAVAEGREL